MKTMNRRPSTVLSRALLAAFLVALPGSRDVFAQALTKVGTAASAAGTSGAVGSTLGGLSAAPALSATLPPASLSLSPLAAPSAATPAALAAPLALKPAVGLVPAAPAKGQPVTAKSALQGAALQAAALNAPALSAGASKSAAAAAFEGGDFKGRGNTVAGVPSALTPSRSAAASTDLVPANPNPEQVEAMRDALVRNVKPGEAVDRATIAQLATGAGVPVAQGLLAVEVLARTSQLVRLGDGVYIFSAAVQRDSSRLHDPMLDQANAKTIDGIDLMNARGLNSRARALASFGEALRLLASVGDDAARAEVTILYKNTALELTRDVLTEYDRNLAQKAAAPEVSETRRVIAAAQSALEGKFYAAGKADPVLGDAAGKAWLNSLFAKLQPSDEARQSANGPAVATGWSLIQAFHKGSPLPDAGVKMVPLAERRRQLFPLIGKEDDAYKALNTYGSNVTRAAVEGKLPP
ncbi:MAG: hypothetical protein NDJ72_11105, partial [Elusimicrobia bacterium]|nr:hypothetical protein [Elusimicrobiota bacterium]